MSNVGTVSGSSGVSTLAKDDFARHDQLPEPIRAWYAQAKLLWVSDDAWFWLGRGLSVPAVIAKLEATEQSALKDEAGVWRLS
jgi:hypothetical protein